MIGRALLIERVRVVASADPDRVYRGGPRGWCSYRPNGNNLCGCLIGEALADAGVPVEKLDELDNAPALAGVTGESVGWGDPTCRRILAGLVTSEALSSDWVTYVQSCQDDEYTWADAVREADDEAGRRGWALA